MITIDRNTQSSDPFAIELTDGATNGTRFRTSGVDSVAPALTPDDSVAMDNLAARKVAGICQLIEAGGARLPSCRPTAPIPARSRTPSPSSKPCCA